MVRIRKQLITKARMPISLIDSSIGIYVQALHDQNAAVFAEAGLSIPAGLVDFPKDMASKWLRAIIAAHIGLLLSLHRGLKVAERFQGFPARRVGIL
jgi:hypothetical protein